MCESQRRGSNRSSVPDHDSVGNNAGDSDVSGGPTLPWKVPRSKGWRVVVWKGTVPSEKETCRPSRGCLVHPLLSAFGLSEEKNQVSQGT